MNKLKFSTKLWYGLGFTSQGIKDGLFQIFLFFYYSQNLGLDAIATGAALTIALLFDAVSDPLVGVISDDWRSEKWGRRHPFMIASAFPLGISLYLLFLPPEDVSHTVLFGWLTVFAILVRLSLTLFIVPAMSLGAEFTTDYEERTSITSYRITFAAFVAPLIIIFGLTVFFIPKEGMSNGLFNVEAYPNFAFLCGILVIITILVSSWFTRFTIPDLPKANNEKTKLTIKNTLTNIKGALKMKSFLSLISFVMLIHVGLGIGIIFTPYFTTYFFGLSEREMAGLIIAPAIGGAIALFLGPFLSRIFDKKWSAFMGTIFFGIFFSLPFNLRLLGWFPDNGAPLLLPLYVTCTSIAYVFLWTTLTASHSMMAEVVDEYELQSDMRFEGLFFSSMSFAYKATIGLGSFIAGLLLTWIAFPKQAEVIEVPDSSLYGLGLIGGPVLLLFYLLPLFFIAVYPITRQRYKVIRDLLHKRAI